MPSNSPSPLPGQPPRRRPRMRVRATAITASLAAVGILASTGPAQAAPARTGAAHHTGTLRCQGKGVDPAALIRYRSDIVIKAPLSTVFKLQTDVERWPSWQAPVLSMKRLDPGPLRKGSRFRWTTPAPATPTTPATTLEITSTVRQFDRDSCIRWTGPAIGDGLRIDEGVHVWAFTKVKGGVRVQTEETWTGAQVEADVPTATALLGAGLEQWLRELKATAEAQSGGPCT
ncbi:SRPBCC family protein [Streptomyces sp. NBC_00038]|uniref:SRPBCC family protein n=1 Tax=Streptomyces sp. NBC_00038 TaxID=2903615 RepID=UPI00225652F2|nr:SRPBCC family protein [Streptomyces sp. NBC_00038]MCX5562352.1 SRPBCC family protein [Streptomyces sp. NBC_00038]